MSRPSSPISFSSCFLSTWKQRVSSNFNAVSGNGFSMRVVRSSLCISPWWQYGAYVAHAHPSPWTQRPSDVSFLWSVWPKHRSPASLHPHCLHQSRTLQLAPAALPPSPTPPVSKAKSQRWNSSVHILSADQTELWSMATGGVFYYKQTLCGQHKWKNILKLPIIKPIVANCIWIVLMAWADR